MYHYRCGTTEPSPDGQLGHDTIRQPLKTPSSTSPLNAGGLLRPRLQFDRVHNSLLGYGDAILSWPSRFNKLIIFLSCQPTSATQPPTIPQPAGKHTGSAVTSTGTCQRIRGL